VSTELPAGAIVKSSRGHGCSNWGETARVVIEVNGEIRSYFLKVSLPRQSRERGNITVDSLREKEKEENESEKRGTELI